MPFDTSWEHFCQSRENHLAALVYPVAQGVLRQDTNHPAFSGCIDWHSCVHGLYALLVVSRLNNEPQWANIAESRFNPELLEQELVSVQQGEINQELPYGFAWFLKLAQEREQFFGKQDLLPLAIEIAKRLEGWVLSLTSEEVLRHTQHPAYGNLSWALLNLWEWVQFREEKTRAEKLVEFTRKNLLPLDQAVPLSLDETTNEFFSVTLQRTRVLLAMLPREERKKWLEAFSSEGIFLQPVEHPSTPHSAGLNFSRSWGFWDLYLHTGKTMFRDHYLNHVVTHLQSPPYWRDDYQRYSHWVPQFGIYAIALSMSTPSPREWDW